MEFTKWLDTLIEEKNLDQELETFEKLGESGQMNFIPLSVVIEHCQIANESEQKQIKDILVKIDFQNGDVLHFFDHLAGALAI